MKPSLSISAEEVNYLVYRYLLESGFKHSVYAFQHESNISQKLDAYRTLNVKPGYLISLLHKALQLIHVDIHMDETGVERDCNATISLLAPHVCSPPDPLVTSLKKEKTLADLKKRMKNGNPIEFTIPHSNNMNESSVEDLVRHSLVTTSKSKKSTVKDQRKKHSIDQDIDLVYVDAMINDLHSPPSSLKKHPPSVHSSTTPSSKKKNPSKPPPISQPTNVDSNAMDIDKQNHEESNGDTSLSAEDILEVQLKGDTSGVVSVNSLKHTLVGENERYYLCAWNPVQPSLLATASLDAVVGLWELSNEEKKSPDPKFLYLGSSSQATPDLEVNGIVWSPDGDYFATSSKDGSVQVYDRSCQSLHSFSHTSKPCALTNVVFALDFSPNSSLLATGSTSGSVNVWDLQTGKQKQVFASHSAAIFALLWLDDRTIVTGSSDTSIVVYDVEKGETLAWREHSGEVNEIKAYLPARLLASCSDDLTVRIWDPTKYKSIGVLRGHEQPISTLVWNPKPPEEKLQLASVSTDSSVRIWDVTTCTCIFNLFRLVSVHPALSYSPDGRHLACGADDQYIYIWSSSTGDLVKTYYGHSSILDLKYNPPGDRLAICFGTPRMVVLSVEPT